MPQTIFPLCFHHQTTLPLNSSSVERASNHLFRLSRPPPLATETGERAGVRFIDFFMVNISNAHTRRAYARVTAEFLAWCAAVAADGIVRAVP
jgi:hypothetical protein